MIEGGIGCLLGWKGCWIRLNNIKIIKSKVIWSLIKKCQKKSYLKIHKILNYLL